LTDLVEGKGEGNNALLATARMFGSLRALRQQLHFHFAGLRATHGHLSVLLRDRLQARKQKETQWGEVSIWVERERERERESRTLTRKERWNMFSTVCPKDCGLMTTRQ
jgi:hypothetical protein